MPDYYKLVRSKFLKHRFLFFHLRSHRYIRQSVLIELGYAVCTLEVVTQQTPSVGHNAGIMAGDSGPSLTQHKLCLRG